MLKKLPVYVLDLETELHVSLSAACLVFLCHGYMSCVILAFLLFVDECLRFRWTMLKSFYRSANAIFGKVGRVAKEDVVLQLLSSKCLLSLLYGV